jgi:hypothetical protein
MKHVALASMRLALHVALRPAGNHRANILRALASMRLALHVALRPAGNHRANILRHLTGGKSETDSHEGAGDDTDFAPRETSVRKRKPSPRIRWTTKLVKSTSVQSYFLPQRAPVATRPAVTATRDPSRPICDGLLDPSDRETAQDMSWSTPISPWRPRRR